MFPPVREGMKQFWGMLKISYDIYWSHLYPEYHLLQAFIYYHWVMTHQRCTLYRPALSPSHAVKTAQSPHTHFPSPATQKLFSYPLRTNSKFTSVLQNCSAKGIPWSSRRTSCSYSSLTLFLSTTKDGPCSRGQLSPDLLRQELFGTATNFAHHSILPRLFVTQTIYFTAQKCHFDITQHELFTCTIIRSDPELSSCSKASFLLTLLSRWSRKWKLSMNRPMLWRASTMFLTSFYELRRFVP